MKKKTAADSMTGRKNIVFGFSYLVFTILLGVYLARYSHEAAWLHREILSSAYLQGNMDSVLNIAAGYLICRLPFVEWLSKVISSLMVFGAFLHSGMLYLAGFGLLPFALNLIPVGAFIIAAVALFLSIGLLSIRIAR